jgi:hypothetical protein
MSDLRLVTEIDAENPTRHDLQLIAGQLQWTGTDIYDADDQADMIAQRVRCRLLLMRGEWYLDQRVGVPWRQTMAAKGTTTARMARIIRRALLGVPGIRRVLDVTVTVNSITRTASISFRVEGDARAVIGPITIDVPYVVTET